MTNALPSSARLDHDLVWVQPLADANRFKGRPALFLDRDGALIEERHYLSDPADVALEAGAADVIKQANGAQVAVVIVTNQSGIARDYFGWDSFARVQDKMIADLAALGAVVDGVYACGHHKTGIGDYQHPDHPARKPNPGMLLRARDDLGIDLASSWIIGDKTADLKAGLSAGIKGGFHVLTGHGADEGERDNAQALACDSFQVLTGNSIAEAASALPILG